MHDPLVTAPPTRCAPPSRATKIAFGLPYAFYLGSAVVVKGQASKYYSDHKQVPLGTLSLAMFACGMLDLASCVCWATLGDSFGRSTLGRRFGRRKPLIALGLPFVVVAVVALLYPPPRLTATATSASVWFVSCYAVYVVAVQCVFVPYLAMGPELTQEPASRSSLYAWQLGLGSAFGLCLFSGLATATSGMGESASIGLLGMGLAAVLIIGIAALLLFVRTDPSPPPQPKQPPLEPFEPQRRRNEAGDEEGTRPPPLALSLLPSIQLCLRNSQFCSFLWAVALLSVITDTTGINLFYVQYVAQPGACAVGLPSALPTGWNDCKCGSDESIRSDCSVAASYTAAKHLCDCEKDALQLYNASVLLLSFLAVPASLLAERVLGRLAMDRRKAFAYPLLVLGVLSTALCLFPSATMFMVANATIGLALPYLVVAANSMLSDICDYDELLTGLRREAMYFSLLRLPQEFFSVAGRSFPLMVLNSAGYKPSVAQSRQVYWALRLLNFGLVALPSFVAARMIFRYKLDRAKQARVVASLAQRKALGDAGDEGLDEQDPVTGKVLVARLRVSNCRDGALADRVLHLTFSQLRMYVDERQRAWLPRKVALHAMLLVLYAVAVLVLSVTKCVAALSSGSSSQSNSYNLALLLCLMGAFAAAFAFAAVRRLQAVHTVVHEGAQMPWMNDGAGTEQAAAVTAAVHSALEERLGSRDEGKLSLATHLPFFSGHVVCIGLVAYISVAL